MYNLEASSVMMKKQSNVSRTTSTPSSQVLGMSKNSQMISKLKPKIRIIHIFAPEIIQTNVENFRELVQRLTGKPSNNISNIKKRQRNIPTKLNEPQSFLNKPLKEEMWNGANISNNGGFFGNLSLDQFDGILEEFNQFPLIPLDYAHHHIDAYGESQSA